MNTSSRNSQSHTSPIWRSIWLPEISPHLKERGRSEAADCKEGRLAGDHHTCLSAMTACKQTHAGCMSCHIDVSCKSCMECTLSLSTSCLPLSKQNATVSTIKHTRHIAVSQTNSPCCLDHQRLYTYALTRWWAEAMGVKVSSPSCRSYCRRTRLSTMHTG